ncbi:hypothetical protein KGO95_03710 [Patescibacteria group bacterium]|nr:hypothetical protein [Patescibacteria group bacterium]
MDTPKPQLNLVKTYLAIINNSVDSRLFRNFYLTIDGKDVDVTRDGSVSCAFLVSNVLNMLPAPRWIGGPHLTVSSTIKDLRAHGWYDITAPRPGAILVWEPKLIHGNMNEHTGFYVGDDMAVSNRYEYGVPIKHHWTYGMKDGKPVRRVITMLWHDALGK